MKELALDTNIAVEILNGKTDTITAIQQYDVLFLPITVVGELLYGAKNSTRTATNLKVFRQFIDQCEELGINNLVAEEYSSIRLQLKKAGKPIPENDIWIAAICIVNDLPLMTRDKHFSNIEGLKLLRI